MKVSRRAKRMQRHHKKGHGEEGLILTSVIDIFTILVFFLLVHMGDQSTIEPPQEIHLPDSTSTKKPEVALVVMVSGADIVVAGRPIMKVVDAEKVTDNILPALLEELKLQRGNSVLTTTPGEEKNPVVVLGDKAIPYRLLKKVMYTLAEARFTDISLAVFSKE